MSESVARQPRPSANDRTSLTAVLEQQLRHLVDEAVSEPEIARSIVTLRLDREKLAKDLLADRKLVRSGASHEVRRLRTVLAAIEELGGALRAGASLKPRVRLSPLRLFCAHALIFVVVLAWALAIKGASAELGDAALLARIPSTAHGPIIVLIAVAATGLLAVPIERLFRTGGVLATERGALAIFTLILVGTPVAVIRFLAPLSRAIGLPWTIVACFVAALVLLVGLAICWLEYFDLNYDRESLRNLAAGAMVWGALLAILETFVDPFALGGGFSSLITMPSTLGGFLGGAVLLQVMVSRIADAEDRSHAKQPRRGLSIDWTNFPLHAATPGSTPRFEERLRLTSELQAEYDRWESVTKLRLILPQLRSRINEVSKPKFSLTMTLHDAVGLTQMQAADYLVRTKGFASLESVLRRLQGGAIGVAGPRGAGKSTLLEAAASGRLSEDGLRPFLVVREAVPVRYDARDFVLHLYSRLCEGFLEVVGVPTADIRRRNLKGLWTVAAAVVFACIAVGLALVGWGGMSISVVSRWLLWPMGLFALVIVAARVDAGVLFAVSMRKRPTSTRQAVAASAQERLLRIRFQQRFTTGWSGKLTVPMGAEFSTSRSRELSQAVQSYPEIVHDFRDFLSQVLRVLPEWDAGPGRGEGIRVLFVIDELDKMESWSAAQAFVNEVKAIFNVDVPGALFLVAVSNEALKSFELEGAVARDAFNSAFDDIVRMVRLELGDSQRLLRSRVIGLPQPFETLCHVVSGGLPRELLRRTRQLVDLAKDDFVVTLSVATQGVLAEDLRERLEGLSHSLGGVDDGGNVFAETIMILERVAGGMPKQPDELFDLVQDLTDVWHRAHREERVFGDESKWILASTLTHAYILATVAAIFTDALSQPDFDKLQGNDGTPLANLLADARVQMSYNSHWSWSTVSELRTRWGLPSIDSPFAMGVSATPK